MTTEEKKASPKRPKKAPVIIGVVAAIVVVAGAGMWVWHEQPIFCGAICHVPMDPYLETYEAEDDLPAGWLSMKEAGALPATA